MVFDLRRALLRKEEIESARLADFEFRLRARSIRLLGERLRVDAAELVAASVEKNDAALLGELAERCGLTREEVAERYAACRAETRLTLIGEIGDPTPHKLA